LFFHAQVSAPAGKLKPGVKYLTVKLPVLAAKCFIPFENIIQPKVKWLIKLIFGYQRSSYP
jgi:hypothetical protein